MSLCIYTEEADCTKCHYSTKYKVQSVTVIYPEEADCTKFYYSIYSIYIQKSQTLQRITILCTKEVDYKVSLFYIHKRQTVQSVTMYVYIRGRLYKVLLFNILYIFKRARLYKVSLFYIQKRQTLQSVSILFTSEADCTKCHYVFIQKRQTLPSAILLYPEDADFTKFHYLITRGVTMQCIPKMHPIRRLI